MVDFGGGGGHNGYPADSLRAPLLSASGVKYFPVPRLENDNRTII